MPATTPPPSGNSSTTTTLYGGNQSKPSDTPTGPTAIQQADIHRRIQQSKQSAKDCRIHLAISKHRHLRRAARDQHRDGLACRHFDRDIHRDRRGHHLHGQQRQLDLHVQRAAGLRLYPGDTRKHAGLNKRISGNGKAPQPELR